VRVTASTKIADVLKINEHMMDALTWLSPSFERLRNQRLQQLMAARISVAQAAQIGRVSLTEALYVLNLTAGEDEKRLACELRLSPPEDFQFKSNDLEARPAELLGLKDDDARVVFVDARSLVKLRQDPRRAVMRGLMELRDEDVLLVRHALDPVALRDSFAQRGFRSWAEERRPNDWYIFFYGPAVRTDSVGVPTVKAKAARPAMAARI